MDELEVDIDDRGDALEQPEDRAVVEANSFKAKPSPHHTESRKRRMSPSIEREENGRDPRDFRRDKPPRGRHDYPRDGPPKPKFRRPFNRLDPRGMRGWDLRMPMPPPVQHQGTWNPEMARAKRWDANIITILDRFDHAKENIYGLAELLSNIADPTKPAFSTLEKAVEAFPVKTGAYASAIGILRGMGKANLAEQITQRLMHNLCSCITSGNRIGAIHLLRFLIGVHSSNVKCCRVMEIIEYLLNLAQTLEQGIYELQEEAVKATIAADNLMYIVMASLPWFSRDEFVNNKETIEGFCREIMYYNERRNYKLAAVISDLEMPPMPFGAEKEPLTSPYTYIAAYGERRNPKECSDRLTSGVECIRSLLTSEWVSSTTYRFYQSKGVREHIFGIEVTEPVSEDITNVTAEIFQALTNLDAKKLYAFTPVPAKYFNFGTEDDAEDISTHDKWLLEEHVLHTVYAFKDDTALCAKHMLKLPHNSFYREHAIADMIFNLMLSPIYNNYFTMLSVLVMQEMCNAEPKIEMLFHQFYSQLATMVDQLDSSVVSNMLNVGAYWFGVEFCKLRKEPLAPYHDTEEKGSEGRSMDVEAEVETAEETKEKIRSKNAKLFSVMFKQSDSITNFNNRLLDKISRLVYVDRLLTYSPEELKANIKTVIQPPIPSVQNALRDKPVEHKAFLDLLHFNKLSPEENDLRNSRIIKIINKLVNKEPLVEIPADLFSDDNAADIEMTDEADETEITDNTDCKRWMRYELILIFWETLLIFGNKSLTHLMRLVEFHGDVLKHFVSQEPSVAFEDTTVFKVLKLTRDTLKSDSKKLELVIDGLIRMHILQPIDACKFVFTYFPSPDFFSNHSFWILQSAVDFVREGLENARTRFYDDAGKSEILSSTLEEREKAMEDLMLALMETINNRLAQGITSELEDILKNVLKNLLMLNARNPAMLMPLLNKAAQKGFHSRIVSALNLALLSQHVKPLY